MTWKICFVIIVALYFTCLFCILCPFCFASPFTLRFLLLYIPFNLLLHSALFTFECFDFVCLQLWFTCFTIVKHINHGCGHIKTSLVSGRNMGCKQKEHRRLVKEIQAGWRKIMMCAERTKAYIKKKAAYLPYFSS